MTETLSLREAYKARKEQSDQKALQEAKELLESSVLIAEKLDTATISRIVDSMNGVEEALKAVIDKLPSLKAGLDSAESELVTLISGKAGNNPKKTGAMMGKAMAFYQHLSSFLRQDLPVLLKSRVLAPAKADPDQPVGPRIAPAFKQALDVTKTGNFIRRLFASTNIPYVDNGHLANELSNLTYNELIGLTKVGTTPAVLTQGQIDQLAAQVAGQAGAAPPSAQPPAATPRAAPPAPTVDPAKQRAAVAKVLEPYMGKKVPDDLLGAILKAVSGAPAAPATATP